MLVRTRGTTLDDMAVEVVDHVDDRLANPVGDHFPNLEVVHSPNPADDWAGSLVN